MDGRRPWRGRYWRAYVHAHADVVHEQLESLYSRVSNDERLARQYIRENVECQLRYAREAAGVPLDACESPQNAPPSSPKRAKGTIEGAFLHLHAAELMLVELFPVAEMEARIPYVIDRLQTCMGQRNRLPRMIEAQFSEQRLHRNEDCLRAVFGNAMRAAYAASDEQHALLKQFRNVLFVGIGIMTALAIGVAAFGYRFPEAIKLCFQPQGGQVCPAGPDPRPLDLALVALLGLLGGALSAAIAIRHMRGSPAPYSIGIALSLLKLPSGALTAIAGLLLVHGKFVPGLSDLDTSGQILAYALIFGFAQQAATQFVDRRAREMLSTVPGREPLTAPTQGGYQVASYETQSLEIARALLPIRQGRWWRRRTRNDQGI